MQIWLKREKRPKGLPVWVFVARIARIARVRRRDNGITRVAMRGGLGLIQRVGCNAGGVTGWINHTRLIAGEIVCVRRGFVIWIARFNKPVRFVVRAGRNAIWFAGSRFGFACLVAVRIIRECALMTGIVAREIAARVIVERRIQCEVIGSIVRRPPVQESARGCGWLGALGVPDMCRSALTPTNYLF